MQVLSQPWRCWALHSCHKQQDYKKLTGTSYRICDQLVGICLMISASYWVDVRFGTTMGIMRLCFLQDKNSLTVGFAQMSSTYLEPTLEMPVWEAGTGPAGLSGHPAHALLLRRGSWRHFLRQCPACDCREQRAGCAGAAGEEGAAEQVTLACSFSFALSRWEHLTLLS